MTRRYALRDEQWERIKDRLPSRQGHVGVTAQDNRLLVKAVLYRYRVGIACKDLPARFDGFRLSCTFATPAGATRGVWRRVFDSLAQDADKSILPDRFDHRQGPPAKRGA